MRGPINSHPDLHRRLAIYHLRKWLFPDAKLPIPMDNCVRFVAPNIEPGGFLDVLRVDYVGGPRPYQVVNVYRYDSKILQAIVTVEEGYRTDFASIPRIFWSILPPHGPYVPAAVVHDWLCYRAGEDGIDSRTTHKVFLEAMKVLRVPLWKRAVMYRAVKWFGPRFRAMT